MTLKVGLLGGREWSFPPAFIEEVNRRDEGVVAEFVKLGGTRMDEPCPYAVIIDRISHEVPYYRLYLVCRLLLEKKKGDLLLYILDPPLLYALPVLIHPTVLPPPETIRTIRDAIIH